MGTTAMGRHRQLLAPRAWVVMAAMLCAALALPGSAAAAGPTRQAYVARIEPICKAGTPPIEHLLSGTRRMANHGEPVAAGRRFVHASNIFSATVRKVASVQRPAPDSLRLAKWIERLHGVKEGMRRIGVALKRRHRLEALNRLGQLRDAGTMANRVVAGFHLHYCRIYESRFS
jgi:hypothetical protein